MSDLFGLAALVSLVAGVILWLGLGIGLVVLGLCFAFLAVVTYDGEGLGLPRLKRPRLKLVRKKAS